MKKLTLKEALYDRFNMDVSINQIRQLMSWLTLYEIRDRHSEAFNTALIGVTLSYFLSKDQEDIFNIFEVEKEDFEATLLKCTIVNKEFKVISDTFNLFITWLCHRIMNSKLPSNIKEDGCVTAIKILHYKFFTSLVNYNFPHKANEELMAATINGLNMKFDIKQPGTNTWKLLLKANSKDVISKASIHHKTLEMYSPDEKVVYVLSDIQTRLRSKIKLIVGEYYNVKERGDRISSYLIDDTLSDASAKNIEYMYDKIISDVTNSLLNTTTLINNEDIKLVCKLNTQIRPDLLSQVLIKFSEYSATQYQDHKGDLVRTIKGQTIYAGYRVFVSKLIQTSYRSAILGKVNMRSKIAILEHVRNIYRSSRITNEEIINVKNSAEWFIMNLFKITRENTVIGLKLSLILYVIIRSMRAM